MAPPPSRVARRAAHEGDDLEDLDLDLSAVGGRVGEGLTGTVSDDRGTQGRLGGEDLHTEVAAGVARSEEELLFPACHDRGDQHAGFDDAVVGGGLPDLGVFENALERADAGLVEGLFVAGRVVAAVLAQVALLTRRIDEARNGGALVLDAVGQLGLQRVILRLRDPLCVCHDHLQNE